MGCLIWCISCAFGFSYRTKIMDKQMKNIVLIWFNQGEYYLLFYNSSPWICKGVSATLWIGRHPFISEGTEYLYILNLAMSYLSITGPNMTILFLYKSSPWTWVYLPLYVANTPFHIQGAKYLYILAVSYLSITGPNMRAPGVLGCCWLSCLAGCLWMLRCGPPWHHDKPGWCGNPSIAGHCTREAGTSVDV